MSDTSTAKCAICEGGFYTAKMKDGKCDACNIRFPGVKDKEDLKKQRETSDSKFNAGSFEKRVEKQVENILKKFGFLIECDCGELYNKRSPAQKSCGICKNKETNNATA